MSAGLQCDIVSAEEYIFSGVVELLVVTGSEGDLGITPGHAPLMTAINPGPIRVKRQDGEEELFFISGGFLEVQPHGVTVLADTALRASDMDEAAAEKARLEAQKSMENRAADFDYSRAAAELADAAARLRTVQMLRKGIRRS